ncbi:hypothetical protein KQI98_14835, partial [Enterococcus sp. S145_ASV_20]|nr:hypothetical protein [Enterococcus sp. S145_ASV_20]
LRLRNLPARAVAGEREARRRSVPSADLLPRQARMTWSSRSSVSRPKRVSARTSGFCIVLERVVMVVILPFD